MRVSLSVCLCDWTCAWFAVFSVCLSQCLSVGLYTCISHAISLCALAMISLCLCLCLCLCHQVHWLEFHLLDYITALSLSGLELIEISFWDSFGNVIKNILKKEVEKKRNILKLCEVFRHPGENILTIWLQIFLGTDFYIVLFQPNL